MIKEFAKNYQGVDNLSTPENIVRVMNAIFNLDNQPEEYLYLLSMTASCRPISFFEVSHGTASTALVGCREIMIRALLSGATNIIIIHNHPSGSIRPSKEDISVTNRMKNACDLIGICFCDHIIVGREGYYSFRERKNI
ncbi:MAG: JAB domain-containing protein [Lachnospiraceae bacterium]|nr:JAB domain-containing protein [Lachnospiraceae bacterium]